MFNKYLLNEYWGGTKVCSSVAFFFLHPLSPPILKGEINSSILPLLREKGVSHIISIFRSSNLLGISSFLRGLLQADILLYYSTELVDVDNMAQPLAAEPDLHATSCPRPRCCSLPPQPWVLFCWSPTSGFLIQSELLPIGEQPGLWEKELCLGSRVILPSPIPAPKCRTLLTWWRLPEARESLWSVCTSRFLCSPMRGGGIYCSDKVKGQALEEVRDGLVSLNLCYNRFTPRLKEQELRRYFFSRCFFFF